MCIFMKENKCKEEKSMSGVLGVSVIMKMTSFLEYPLEYEIFFDNFFTSFDLLVKLKDCNKGD